MAHNPEVEGSKPSLATRQTAPEASSPGPFSATYDQILGHKRSGVARRPSSGGPWAVRYGSSAHKRVLSGCLYFTFVPLAAGSEGALTGSQVVT